MDTPARPRSPTRESPAGTQARRHRSPWYWAEWVPALSAAVYVARGAGFDGAFALAVVVLALMGAVLAAVHHAEVIAHRVGEPFGTLVLAVCVTLIEVALIVSMMLAAGESGSAIARDTVFAAVMIVVTGIVGLSLLVGGAVHREQAFGLDAVSASLATLAAIAVLTLVFPSYTTTVAGPYYSPGQLALVSIATLILYVTFVLMQTVRHRGYFLDADDGVEDGHASVPSNFAFGASIALLLAALTFVVLLAKSLSGPLEVALEAAGAPGASVGVLIAALVLLPEGFAAVRAARMNRLQTSLNLALGSALASIGLTIPIVSLLALTSGTQLVLGIDAKSAVLLLLALFVASLALRTGRTIVLHGVVLLVVFAVYLFTTFVP
jgi:Ca2+:H+ antiporter